MPDLHLEILRPPQRRLWSAFQDDPEAIRSSGFVLAGGTALALQMGHRESHDFDFFSQSPGVSVARSWLEKRPGLTMREADTNTIHAELSGVKVSFIAGYRYPFLRPAVPVGPLLLADILDIGLMKMIAITHRATVRDYIDLAAILRERHPISLLIEKSREKYGPSFNPMLALRTLVHFDDLDEEVPVLLDPTLADGWRDILRQAVKEVA